MPTTDTYRHISRQLAPLYGEGEGRAIARLLLEEAFGLTMADVLSGAADRLSAEERATLDSMVSRLLRAEPIQYVLGKAEFCGHVFHVESGVLVPRPETQQLCEWVLATVDATSALRLLDIGTGSGCIATTLAVALPHAHVTAWDISQRAIDVARRNAAVLGAKVAVEHADALCPPDDGRVWDIIVSNPPYIAESEQAEMHPNVLLHEPHEALFVPDADPLLFYRAIAHYALQSLSPGGLLFMECSSLRVAQTAALLREAGFVEVETRDDIFGLPRHIKATRP